MLKLLFSIPSLLTGLFNLGGQITAAISNEKIAVINATTEEERIAAQERVNTLTLRRDTMIAEAATSTLNVKMRFLLALGPMSVLLKIFLWDKVIGSIAGCSQAAVHTCGIFVTDPLDGNLWQVVMVVLGFYFLCETASGIAKIFK
jgi:hypothetical protein